VKVDPEFKPKLIQYSLTWTGLAVRDMDEIQTHLTNGWEPFAVTEGNLWLRRRFSDRLEEWGADDPA
jgi:hypothetical protein